MALMEISLTACADMLLGDCTYIFGGYSDEYGELTSVERYSILGNTWEDLPNMGVARWDISAVAALRNDIFILGGYDSRVLALFDTELLEWKAEAILCDMPGLKGAAAAAVLKNRYLVVIAGKGEYFDRSAGWLIYDCWSNQWSRKSASVNMFTARDGHTAAVIDGEIVVAGGQYLSSMECIDANDILK